jgi:hypothetical protein
MPMSKTRFEKLIDFTMQSQASAFATRPMVELQALSLVSSFVNTFRIQVEEEPGRFIFPSILAILEAPSGAGKNSGVRFMYDFIFRFSFDSLKVYWEGKERDDYEAFKVTIKEELLVEFPESKDAAKRLKQFEKRKKAYFRARRPLAVMSATDGSYEGFAFDRAYLGIMKLGAPFLVVEEYGNKIVQMQKASYLRRLYDSVVDLVDKSELGEKSIKDKDGGTPGSDGMGITCYFTLANPTERQRETIVTSILQAVGRRGFVLRETLESLDVKRALKLEGTYCLDELESFEQEVGNLFNSLMDTSLEAEVDSRVNGNVVIPFAEGAKEYYETYRKRIRELYVEHILEQIKSERKRNVATLLKDVDRKALKVAVILAVFNHGDKNFEITKEDLKQGGELVWKFFKHAKTFFDTDEESQAVKILSFLQEHKEASARDLYDAGLFPELNARNIQEDVYSAMMDFIKEEAKGMSYELQHFKVGKQDRYSLTKIKHAK